MRQHVAKRVPLPGTGGVDQQKPGDRGQRVLVGHVDAARSADPAQFGVKQHQPHQPEPEDRHRIADQAHHANNLIDNAATPHRRPDAERHAEPGPDEDAQRRQFDGRRKGAANVLHHRVRRQHRGAEIALRDLCQVNVELLVERLIQAELLTYAGDHVLGRAVANDGQHRVDGHHAADEEGDGEQTQIGQYDGGDKAASQLEPALPGWKSASGSGHRYGWRCRQAQAGIHSLTS